jgi:hypothetical protein
MSRKGNRGKNSKVNMSSPLSSGTLSATISMDSKITVGPEGMGFNEEFVGSVVDAFNCGIREAENRGAESEQTALLAGIMGAASAAVAIYIYNETGEYPGRVHNIQ